MLTEICSSNRPLVVFGLLYLMVTIGGLFRFHNRRSEIATELADARKKAIAKKWTALLWFITYPFVWLLLFPAYRPIWGLVISLSLMMPEFLAC